MSDETIKTTEEAPKQSAVKVGQIPASQPKNRKRNRVGRGHAAGQGKTCGRGIKGQRARTSVRRGFEGGQNPLQRRLPQRRGVSQRALNIGVFRKSYAEVNVGRLEATCKTGAVVTIESLIDAGVVKSAGDGLRVLGVGELTKPLTVRARHFTKSAKAKIEAAGGSAELI